MAKKPTNKELADALEELLDEVEGQKNDYGDPVVDDNLLNKYRSLLGRKKQCDRDLKFEIEVSQSELEELVLEPSYDFDDVSNYEVVITNRHDKKVVYRGDPTSVYDY